MMSCKFCTLAESGRAFGTVAAFPDAYPVTPGHMLIVPLRHTPDFFTVTTDEMEDVETAIRALSTEAGRDVTGFNIGWNCGVSAGQTVQHAHCHLIPRRGGDTPVPAGGVRGVIPGKQQY